MLNELAKLYNKVDRCGFCKKDNNELQHIHGFGAMKPRLMLVLINPTHRNISSRTEYRGQRFPFIGVRQFWRVLAAGGLIDKKITDKLPLKNDWTIAHTKSLQNELLRNRLFLSNIVKCCYPHSAYPSREVIAEQLNILREEIRIVKPKKIVAFGALVYKTLTGKQIKFLDYDFNLKEEREIISGLNIPVVPCYFPIGRGNPTKAAKMLKRILSK